MYDLLFSEETITYDKYWGLEQKTICLNIPTSYLRPNSMFHNVFPLTELNTLSAAPLLRNIGEVGYGLPVRIGSRAPILLVIRS